MCAHFSDLYGFGKNVREMHLIKSIDDNAVKHGHIATP